MKDLPYSIDQIRYCADKAALISYKILGLDNANIPGAKATPYTVKLIDDPAVSEDGLLGTRENEILINLAQLEPFPSEIYEDGNNTHVQTAEEKLLDEKYRLVLKIYFLVFHEMRHIYQKRAVEIYTVNHMLGGRPLTPLENDKKCGLWLSEMQGYELGPEATTLDIEEDADAFAYYLSNRYPIQIPMQMKSRRLAALKRKYDRITIDGM